MNLVAAARRIRVAWHFATWWAIWARGERIVLPSGIAAVRGRP